MDRLAALTALRTTLAAGKPSVGSWMQIPNASLAEILGAQDFEWIAVDLEHGAFAPHLLPDIFRALELRGTLPLARLEQGSVSECKRVLDAGAAGVIVPMIRSADQLRSVANACRWPPAGTRGVGFSRANLFGQEFESYVQEAQQPLLVAMIEHAGAVSELDEILSVRGLDAIFVGPYDLSASMGLTGQFDAPEFKDVLARIMQTAKERNIPSGMHVVPCSPDELEMRIGEGYQFVAYSIDTLMLRHSASAISHIVGGMK